MTTPPPDHPGREPAGPHLPTLAELRGPAPAGMRWMEASWSQLLPVPAERVWALVSDLSRRPEWDARTTSVTVDADGRERRTDPEGRTVTQTVVQSVPGWAIAWRVDTSDTVEGTSQVLQLVLQPAGTDTRLQVHRCWPTRGLGVRLSRPLLVRMVRVALRVQAQGIAQAA